MSSHVAVVTGANHGIGAATAVHLGSRGLGVLCTYLRVLDEPDPGVPQRYRTSRAAGVEAVLEAVEQAGGRAVGLEADLTDPGAPARILDLAQERLGPVDVLVNNATGWVQDTFRPARTDHLGRSMQPVSAATFSQQFAVDAMAPALLIAEFARRHVARGAGWGRIVGLTSGGPDGFPEEVSYGAAKAAQENYTKTAATELAGYGITANLVHPPVTDTGWVTDAVRELVANSAGLTHVATAEQVAEVIGWLVSDAAALVSGNVLRLR